MPEPDSAQHLVQGDAAADEVAVTLEGLRSGTAQRGVVEDNQKQGLQDGRFRPGRRISKAFSPTPSAGISWMIRVDIRCPSSTAHSTGLARLRSGTMPCAGAWPEEKTDLFQRWAESGFQP